MINMARCLFLLFITLNAFAIDEEKIVSSFHQRFQVVKENGKTTKILDRLIVDSFNIRPYVAFIKESLLEEQLKMRSKTNYFDQISF